MSMFNEILPPTTLFSTGGLSQMANICSSKYFRTVICGLFGANLWGSIQFYCGLVKKGFAYLVHWNGISDLLLTEIIVNHKVLCSFWLDFCSSLKDNGEKIIKNGPNFEKNNCGIFTISQYQVFVCLWKHKWPLGSIMIIPCECAFFKIKITCIGKHLHIVLKK